MLTKLIIHAAQSSHKRFWPRGPFVSVTLAQFGLESGWGLHVSGINNFFGIQANRAQIAAGEYSVRSSWEHLGGEDIPEEEKFANYTSVEAGFDAHAILLTSTHYQRCIDAFSPDDYCDALQACGYATAPTYATVLKKIISSSKLTQYDEVL